MLSFSLTYEDAVSKKDVKNRCKWCLSDPLYIEYHDKYWGVPEYNDKKLFEMLVLEGAQAGLNWLTILKKQSGYKKAFHNYSLTKIAKMEPNDVGRLMLNPDIIRNRLKINSVIKNARCYIRIQKEYGSFANYIWGFIDAPINNEVKDLNDVPAKTELSLKISKSLKKNGFSFVGPTIIYAYMQAIGMVNDHQVDCWRHDQV